MIGEQTQVEAENKDKFAVDDLNVYPNPTSGNLNVSFGSSANEKYIFKVMDVLGNILINESYTSQDGDNTEQLNLNHIAGGIYFLRVEKEGKEIKTMRIIVQ